MKLVFGLAALAGLAGTGMAQSMYLSASSSFPADGEVVTIDVVLDATSYSGDFFAWHSFGFNIQIDSNVADGAVAGQIGGALLEDQILETADTTGFAATGFAWTGGRRPGAFPGLTTSAGGSRFGPQLADAVTDTLVGSTTGDGTISGRQESPAAPEHNALINQSRVYEIFRFQLTYTAELGGLCLGLQNASASLYSSPTGDDVVVTDGLELFGISIGESCIPSPGGAAAIGMAALVGCRRRS